MQIQEKYKKLIRTQNRIIHDLTVTMQCALIAARTESPEKALQWIYNALGPSGNLPDEHDEWINDANMYYRKNCSEPFGPCDICGKPSGILGKDHRACCKDHFDALEKPKH